MYFRLFCCKFTSCCDVRAFLWKTYHSLNLDSVKKIVFLQACRKNPAKCGCTGQQSPSLATHWQLTSTSMDLCLMALNTSSKVWFITTVELKSNLVTRIVITNCPLLCWSKFFFSFFYTWFRISGLSWGMKLDLCWQISRNPFVSLVHSWQALLLYPGLGWPNISDIFST